MSAVLNHQVLAEGGVCDELVLRVPYVPHVGQRVFHECGARFRVLACGRRWGKTKCGAAESVRRIVEAGSDSVGFVVAPTFTSTSLGKCWREFLRFCPPELIRNYPHGIHRTPGDRYIELLDRRIVYFKSADRPDTLAGEGLSFVWCDEPAQYAADVWERVLPPALMDRKGLAWFTGTPSGRNWYFRLYMEGQDPKNTEVKSWNFPSYQNAIENGGYIPKAEIDAIANRLPQQARLQEIMGIFLEDVGTVFRGIGDCVKGELEPPQYGSSYTMGVDLAKHADFTVACVLNQNGHLVAFDRFSELNWVFQRKRLATLAQRYDARVVIDSTGIGDPIYDEFRRDYAKLEGYKLTHASKMELIENLSLQIENGEISYPDIPELINELTIYGWTKTKGGTIVYNAPEGYHDDCVVALALATWQLRLPKPNPSFLLLGGTEA